MTAMTAAQLLVACLAENGTDRVFGVPGESYLAVLDALHDRNDIQFINCRQEGGAAMAAEADGKLTGRPGVCMVTRGPGATNASSGVHVAFQDSTPMILLVGQVGRGMVDREAFQEIDYRRMFGQMAKWVAQIDDPARVPEYMTRAFSTALSGRPGPVVLALPEDMLTETVPDAVVPEAARPVQSAPTPEALAELRDMLAASTRPLLLVGGGGWSAAVSADVRAFAVANEVPVAATFRCQDYLDNGDPYYVGHVGIGVDPNLGRRVKESDLLMVLGPRLGEMTTGGYKLLPPPEAGPPLVHIHAGAEELNRVYRATLPINAAAAAGARALAALGQVRQDPDVSWRTGARADYLAFCEGAPSPGAVQMRDVVRHISDTVGADAIVSNGAGNYAVWVHRFFAYRKFRSELAPTSGSMGYGLPAAVAAAARHPDRPVVCFAGDGCFMMTCQEFSTAVHYGLKLVAIVANNGMYATIRMHQERHYPGRVSGTDLVNPDFAALALAMGGHGETVTATEDFPAAFARALAAPGPALIELKLDPEALTPTQTLSQVRGG
ncbi:MAG: thiamine pyrophosphate-binding protein [Hyphomicrobiales bacterium]|nr:thiamine pyrophosphate-binding protein [Hyphomicrobiales bacterium]MCP5370376.1 thiamine pyrophosphate-binding protein [Hyphomicrobiales bacterium]